MFCLSCACLPARVSLPEQAWCGAEFQTALLKTRMPRRVRMVVLCSRPNYELRAFQVHRHPAWLPSTQRACSCEAWLGPSLGAASSS